MSIKLTRMHVYAFLSLVVILINVCVSFRTQAIRYGKYQYQYQSIYHTPAIARSISRSCMYMSSKKATPAGNKTKANKVAKKVSKYEDPDSQYVERTIKKEDRKPLAEYKQGQKVRGKIISMRDFGFFVDIGSSRDGLVHVKDISKDYFIQNHQSKFTLGQEVDAWIKFVDADQGKLGLQCFPLIESIASKRPELAVSFDELSVGDEVKGTVVRVSNYGVFVDIGADVHAFLHTRKMKISRKKFSLKPWELAPVGSTVTGYIHELKLSFRGMSGGRIGLTTYPPVDWDAKLPMGRDNDEGDEEYDEEDDDLQDFEDELGDRIGSRSLTKEGNERALERILDLNLGDEDEDDEDDDDDDGDDDNDGSGGGDYLSDAEIEALNRVRTKSKVLIDDTADGSTKASTSTGTVKQQPKRTQVDEGEDMSTEELFEELCGSNPYVTARDLIKKWDFLSQFIEDGSVTEAMLTDLFKEVGAKGGKLLLYQFDDFIDSLADALNLSDYDDEDEDEDEDVRVKEVAMSQVKVISQPLIVIDDTTHTSTKSSKAKVITAAAAAEDDDEDGNDALLNFNDNDDDDDDAFESLGFGNSSGKKSKTISIKANANTNEAGTEGNKESLSTYYEKKSKNGELLQYVFRSVSGGKEFVTLDDVMKWDFVLALQSQGASTAVLKNTFDSISTKTKGKLSLNDFEQLVTLLSNYEASSSNAAVVGGSSSEVKSTIPIIQNAADLESYEDQETYDNVFSELAAGKSFVTLAACKAWIGISELLEDGLVSPEQVQTHFYQAGGQKGKDIIDRDGFEAFLDHLQPYAVAGGEDGDVDDEEDDEELLQDVFDRISQGKGYVSLNDLMNWDLVVELMGEQLIDEDKLGNVMKSCGAGKKGLDIDAFDTVVNQLVEMYENSIEADDVNEEE